MNEALRFRQIHLDFHTSEVISRIGADFDPEEFAATLEQARVNSITCFARCHHGWMYYDTQVFPERRHPHLTRNLLKEQIEACHARNIRVPIYVTIQWDHFTASRYPEWLALTADGRIQGTQPYEAGFYRNLCVNSPYLAFLKAHVKEILEMFPVDGFFFDIVKPLDDSSRWTQAGMEAEGLNPADAKARQAYGIKVIDDFKRELSAFVREIKPEATIFYNAGHVGPRQRATIEAYSHWELESLPSGGWGYMHFPISARYARTMGLESLGMTGKFHTSWGDFHSFKNKAALQFECYQMLALNTKCSIGDQLSPGGKIDPTTYELVGSVYSQVEQKEPWCRGAKAVTQIAVFTPEAFYGEEATGRVPAAVMGATRMLQEGAHQFDLIDPEADFSAYRVLILPDTIPVTESFAAKLEAYLEGGGALLASFESGLNEAQTQFNLKALGVRLTGETALDAQGRPARGRYYPHHDFTDYLIPRGEIGRGLPATEHAMHMKELPVAVEADVEVLAELISSYFDRSYRHFCSHRQTPSSGQVAGPAIVRKGRAIYFAHPIFTQYAETAPLWVKKLFLNALGLLLPDPLVRHRGPSTLLVSLNEQIAENRQALHLLHYIPERRALQFDIIEDVIPLFDLALSVKVPRMVKSVECVPERTLLDFVQKDGRVEFTLPKLEGHQIIALNF
jgi:hypothetical protein